MTRELNLHDIQGNVTRAYGRYSFPFARYIFFHFPSPRAGRAFVDMVRKKVTTSARWTKPEDRPLCTINVGLTFPGLLALQLPVRTLQAMPDEFIEGMKARAFILGDRDQTETEEEAKRDDWDKHWDPIWQKSREPGTLGFGVNDVHMMVGLNAQSLSQATPDKPHSALEEQTSWLLDSARTAGVKHLQGIGSNGDQPYQDASAVFEKIGNVVVPTPKEHFGFTDGIGNPVFEGQYPEEEAKIAVIGQGKQMGKGWQPIATGEFILGHPDESQELPPSAAPPEFMQNGTFFAFRKLHENVCTFDEVVREEATRYAKVMEIGLEEAVETLRAKMAGRWSDGVPLSVVPTYAEWVAFGEKMGFRGEGVDPLEGFKKNIAYIASPEAREFRYADDMGGYKCPLGAHMRRVNTRDYLDPLNQDSLAQATQPLENANATSALNNRRRLLRRGLPYGPSNFDKKDDETEQGVIMMTMGASLFRQFEFVQQQWIQYGLDFHQGNNTCPMIGNHGHHKRCTIPSDPRSGKPPYVMSKLKTFVECRGGDYFFAPSLTALRMMAMGIVDPT
ncbi:peroxidase [Puniceibacterium antarcticum]|uniref:Peroxidase n=1 Tax=Puniceibacterium antarcticum TaxID=1206336 RepID=A0A2G8R6R2_9RHOB|nr:peroxidase [Puniceibacterium antarcticum]PIL17245.1 peroxidase [Puniceibacterium antarcticum]